MPRSNNPSSQKIVFVAGEESGDMHAAHCIKELLQHNPNLVISGIGGKHMQAAGATVINDLARYGVTGITEVFKQLFVLKRAMKQIKAHLRQTKPDLLILVDYPGFNLRLAKFAKQQLGLTIIYYISPQIWAWKAKRLDTIRQYIDHMAVILPFEKKIYQDGHVPVSFVGHPLLTTLSATHSTQEYRHSLGLPETAKIIALLPGSREHEIQRHMPIFMQTAVQLSTQHAQLHFVIPVAKTLTTKILKAYIPATLTNISLINGHAVEVVASSDCVVVASGTASLECALLGKPMCIVYKAAWLSYVIATQVIKVNYLGLCNLLQNKMLVPELLQDDFNTTELSLIINQLLSGGELVDKMLSGFSTLKQSLSEGKIDESLCTLIHRYLSIKTQ